MKLIAAVFLFFIGGAVAEAGLLQSTPISRVVDLLQRLSEKLEEGLKAEEKLYKKYECWFTTVTDTKTASNDAANSRIQSLQQYIADIDAGKIEFTTERVDLEKQVAGLSQDLETAETLRNQEHTDYRAAKVELQQALAALSEAIAVLTSGTSPIRGGASGAKGAVKLLSARWSLRKALQFSREMLNKDDQRLLQHLLNGDVPNYDWNKLNREATFKQNYTAASGTIIATLQKLQQGFTADLAEVEAKEGQAQSTYNALKSSKESMLATAQTALIDLVEENGARGLSKSEAQAEVDALTAQVQADVQFISEAQTAYNTKKTQWEERQRVRNDELSAITKAIAVLHGDEARDTFAKSFASQGYSLVQEHQSSLRSVRHPARAAAANVLRSLKAKSGDGRIALLAGLMSATGLEQVVSAIDGLVAALNTEEADDLQKKESCETQLANSTASAKTVSRDIDGITDEVTRIEERVEELTAEIKEEESKIVEFNETLTTMVRNRADEAAQFAEDKTTDENALQVIDNAMTILTEMLARVQGTSFLQLAQETSGAVSSSGEPPSQAVSPRAFSATALRRPPVAAIARRGRLQVRSLAGGSQPYQVEAGQAPPPPPATWEDPTYTGAEGESSGIITILQLVREDVQKDIDMADAAENAAIADYNTQKGDLEASITAAEDAIDAYDAEIANLESDKVDKASEKSLKKDQLTGIMDEIKALQPGCDYVLVNYPVRTQKRQIEIDGLLKAKAILEGATFA